MAEFELEGLGTERLTQNLMAEANPKSRQAMIHKLLHVAYRIIQGGRVTGAED